MKRVRTRPDNKCYMGHEMTPANTYTYPSGKTDCRLCSRARWKIYYRRSKRTRDK